MVFWEEDLHYFEIISKEERDTAIAAFVDPYQKKEKPVPLNPRRRNIDQLALPFGDNYQVVRHGQSWFAAE